MNEQRLENRFLCADLAKVNWYVESGVCGAAEAVLEDISRVGACVQVENAIPLAATVSLAIGQSTFTGKVRYCVYRDYGYFVGIRFEDASSWSAAAVEPQHLTDIGTIAQKACVPSPMRRTLLTPL
ncbi:MAG TPA: hypothetical protein VKB79_05485 [Bryobacteraceae bacterium]|nr:hypothetical protein [Bryobacteraceae bacterium]